MSVTQPLSPVVPDLSSDAIAQLILQQIPSLTIQGLVSYVSIVQQIYAIGLQIQMIHVANTSTPVPDHETLILAVVQVVGQLITTLALTNPVLSAALLEINHIFTPLVIQEWPTVRKGILIVEQEIEQEIEGCGQSFYKWICCAK